MFYLIGGAPRVGKSIIAQELTKSVKGRLVSTDDLENQSGRSSWIPFSSDPEKNTLAPAELVKVLISEADLLQGDMNGMLKEAKAEKKDIVFEGVHLLPKYVSTYKEALGEEKFKIIFIGSTNTGLILQGMAENTSPDNWLKTFDQTVRKQIALFANAFSKYLITETQKFSLPYKERSSDFQEDLTEIENGLLSPNFP